MRHIWCDKEFRTIFQAFRYAKRQKEICLIEENYSIIGFVNQQGLFQYTNQKIKG